MYGLVTEKETPCRAGEGSAIHGAGRRGAGRGRGARDRGTSAAWGRPARAVPLAPGGGGGEVELRARGPALRSPGEAAQRSAWDGAGPRESCTHAIPGRGVPWEQHTSPQDVEPDGCPSRRGIPVWPRSVCNLERVDFSLLRVKHASAQALPRVATPLL